MLFPGLRTRQRNGRLVSLRRHSWLNPPCRKGAISSRGGRGRQHARDQNTDAGVRGRRVSYTNKSWVRWFSTPLAWSTALCSAC